MSRSQSPRRTSQSPRGKPERSRSPIKDNKSKVMGCKLLNKRLAKKEIKFKIILTILAHGCSENLCDRIAKINPRPDGNKYIDNFETSAYIDNISLYSMVPYGLNNVSASYGPGSRRNKQEFILKMQKRLKDKYNLYIDRVINSHIGNAYGKLSVEQRDEKLLNDYSLTDYDIIIDNILHNFSGSYTTDNISATLMLTGRDKGSKMVDYFKDEMSKSRDFIDPQVIVKERYTFSDYALDKYNPDDTEQPEELVEFSGIHGVSTTYKNGKMDDILTNFDFTNVSEMEKNCGIKIWSVIYNYIKLWNEYIKTVYTPKDTGLQLNTIELQYADKNPIRIKKINTQSLYHIIFLYLNGLEDTDEYKQSVDFLTGKIPCELPSDATPMSGDTVIEDEDTHEATATAAASAFHAEVNDFTNMECFLNYFNENSNIDLYLISYACRGAWGNSESCPLVNEILQQQQKRLRCKKEGLEYFRPHYIREKHFSGRYGRGGGSKHNTTKKHKKSKRHLSKRHLSKRHLSKRHLSKK